MPVELRTQRLVLRPFQPGDAAAFAAFADDPAYRRHLGPRHPSAAQFVANNLAVDWERAPSWAIVFEDRVVGSIFLGVDPDDAIAELACLIAPAFWRNGLAREAGRAVIGYAFADLGLYKVFARAAADNEASRRSMENAGMRQEGVLRSHRAAPDGSRTDEVMYGLTRDEWRAT